MLEFLTRILLLPGLSLVFLSGPLGAQTTQYETRQDVQDAISRYDQLIENTPEDATAYVKRADAFFLLLEFDMAIKDYTAAIERDDSLDLAYLGRGLAYGRRRLIDEGIADLDVFLRRNPDSSLGYTKRGVRYLWKRDLERAADDLEKAIALDPYNAEAHDDLGVVYSLQDKYGEAIAKFLETVAIDPAYQKGYHNLAMSLYVTEKDQWALNAVNESLKLKPQSRDSMYLKGLILKALGRGDEAEETLEDAAFLPEGNWSEAVTLPPTRGVTPDLILTGIDEKEHRFSDYFEQGKWIILNVWAPKCPPCIEEVPILQAFHDEHFENDAIVIGLAIDYPSFGFAKIAEVKQFVDLYAVTYPILLGDADMVPRFGAGPLLGTPTTIIFTPDGKLAGHQVGQVNTALLEGYLRAAMTGGTRSH